MDDKINLQIKEKQTVRVFQKITEGKRERNVPFIGVVQKVRGSQINKTITVKTVLEGVEVEKIFPIASPSITKIEIVEEKKTTKKSARKKSKKSSK